MSQIEAKYDELLTELQGTLGKIDIDLAMRVLYFERKFNSNPHVDLEIEFREGTDCEKKRFQIYSKHGLQVGRLGDRGLAVSGLANIEIISELSQDPDVEMITGKANPSWS